MNKAPNPWWVAVVCGLASFIDAAAIVSSGTALVIYQHALGLGASQIGILAAALTVGIALGALLGGRLGDQHGRRRVFTMTMVMIVVGSALQVFGGGFELLLVGTTLVGLGTGGDLPVSLATIAEHAPDEKRGKLIAFSGQLWLGGIATSILIAAIVGNWGHLGGQILYGQVLVIAVITLLLRLTIPESPVWLAARVTGSPGSAASTPERARVRDLLRSPFVRPFIALLLFYALVNLGANTSGQFGTYIAVNVIGIDVSLTSIIGLIFLPLGFAFTYWFMRIVDTRHRFMYFLIGGIAMVAQYALPALFGFSLPLLFVGAFLAGFGGAFAFEGIMKVWTQESFPTLLRTTAQGSILFFARILAAALASVTPLAIEAGPRVLYTGLAAVTFAGLAFAFFEFRGKQRDILESEVEAGVSAPSAAADDARRAQG
ncbi:MFS transporter [Nonomuraea sp. CA-143628]|uniref:MFS transporter n=1 Tax=Nonomuraea sp. CA-143628 TaxID=3239997 RepID=UPI003D8EEADB